MKSRPESHRRASRQALPLAIRRGFTMTELLIVITVMSILISLIAIGGVGFITQAKVAATQTTIKKVDEAIQERVGAVNRWHMRPINRLRHDWDVRGWTNRWMAYGLSPFAGVSGGQQSPDDVMTVLSRKGMLIELLPGTQAELKQSYWFWARFIDPTVPPKDRVMMINGVPVSYLSPGEQAAMQAWLDDIDPDTTGNQSLDTPGEVFLYALQYAPVFGAERVAEEDFRSSELIDGHTLPDGTVVLDDGVMELGDAWGNGLRFYRWPTKLVNNNEPLTADWTDADNIARKTLMPNAPTLDLKQDPDDRAGYLSLNNPLYGGPIAAFFHDMNTWHAPLVLSAGPDGQLGVDEPGTPYPLGTIPRYGLAEVLFNSGDPTVRQRALEAIYDNISNHNSTGGL